MCCVTEERLCVLGLVKYVTLAILGSGNNHKDAASVRASHPIPPACGIYYFEIRVISKGRDGLVLTCVSYANTFIIRLGVLYLDIWALDYPVEELI